MRTMTFLLSLLAFLLANNGTALAAPVSPENSKLVCETPVGLTFADLTGTTAVLGWQAVAGASGYTIEVQNEENTPPFFVEVNVNTNSYTATGLQQGGLYKFKVRSLCGGDNSDWSEWLFFTSTNGGGGPGGSDCTTIPTGLAVLSADGTSANLSWDVVAGATSYEVEVEDESNTPGTFFVNVTVTTNAYTVTGLTAGQSYKFKVKAKCASGSSDYSPWFSFNSSTGGPGGGGGDCTMIPTGLAVLSADGTSANLSWDVVAGATSYEVEVEDDSNNPLFFHVNVTVATNAYTVTGLTAGQSYKFKVKAKCASGSSDYSPWFSFNSSTGGTGGGTGGVCGIPAGLAVSNANGTSATLTWNAVSGALAYEIEVEDGSNNPNNFKDTAVVTGTSYVVTGLLPNLNYKFKVKSKCTSGSSDYSPWLSFNSSTGFVGGGGVNGGSDPSCGQASGLAVTDVSTTSAKLKWNKVAGATSYKVRIENGKNNPDFFRVTATTTDTVLTVQGLQANKSYKFKVRTICGSTQSAWTSWFHFTTPAMFISDDADDRSNTVTEPVVAMRVMPNPVRSEAVVHLDGLENSAEAQLILRDLNGKTVWTSRLVSMEERQQVRLETSELASGLYLLQLLHDGVSTVQKIVVQHGE